MVKERRSKKVAKSQPKKHKKAKKKVKDESDSSESERRSDSKKFGMSDGRNQARAAGRSPTRRRDSPVAPQQPMYSGLFARLRVADRRSVCIASLNPGFPLPRQMRLSSTRRDDDYVRLHRTRRRRRVRTLRGRRSRTFTHASARCVRRRVRLRDRGDDGRITKREGVLTPPLARSWNLLAREEMQN